MPPKIYINNYWYDNNYGACLTAYALYYILKDLNYKPYLVDLNNYKNKPGYLFKNFIMKYCNTTNGIKTVNNLKELSNNILISGSDQVFRPHIAKRNLKYFLLDYVNEQTKKIAFSASFGVDINFLKRESSSESIEHIKKSLKTFDFISVREKSGVKICRDLFNVDAEWIIDPVFIINKIYYEKIINNAKIKYSNKIVSCMFDKKNSNLDKYLYKKYKTDVIELWGTRNSMETVLYAIKNSKLVVTNSYHIMCFAIIFNKPFISVINKTTGSARYNSLLEMLNINNQCIDSINEIYEKDCIFKLDYELVNKRIFEESNRGMEFLTKALEAPIQKTKEKQEIYTEFLENRLLELEEEKKMKNQIKQFLWEKLLVIYYKLPKFLKDIIKNIMR